MVLSWLKEGFANFQVHPRTISAPVWTLKNVLRNAFLQDQRCPLHVSDGGQNLQCFFFTITNCELSFNCMRLWNNNQKLNLFSMVIIDRVSHKSKQTPRIYHQLVKLNLKKKIFIEENWKINKINFNFCRTSISFYISVDFVWRMKSKHKTWQINFV